MTSPGSFSPTEADWEAAAHARFGPVWRLLRLNDMQRHEVDRIAVALADERERVRAPFLALAARYDGLFGCGELVAGIRRAAEEAT